VQRHRLAVALALLAIGSGAPRAQAPATAVAQVTVAADKPGPAIAPTMYGIFFEDINFAADGGLYPEKVKNRSFEFPEALMGWKKSANPDAQGDFAVRTDRPASPDNPHYVRVTSRAGSYGITNDGFRSVSVEAGKRYVVTMLARRVSGTAGLTVGIENARMEESGSAPIASVPAEWGVVTATITPPVTNTRARFRVRLDGPGAVDLDMVSLMPADTWKNRPNGLRADLVQLLADLKPGFLRFPGGCIVEGRYLETRYEWKKTIGAPADRTTIINRWNDEFGHRQAADYFQSFGLGFYEYFQLSEDIGAEPLPILNCGMACQFNTNELVPLDQLDPYVQDALDLIEFANGPVTSVWGKRRADMGHPAPFNLKFIGVGNEQWGPQYVERYAVFHKILKAKHPEIKLISSAGPSPDGERFDFLWSKMRELGSDIVDEHYYMPPAWFFANANRYDKYPRTGPKVFAGEFAAHENVPQGRQERPSTLHAALAEAAFMTGLERNADVVQLASYAPLLAHVDAWQWSPNLIWFDNLRSVGTPSYHVQRLFGQHKGTTVLPATITGLPTSGIEGVFASASRDAASGDVIVKLVNPGPQARDVKLVLTGVTPGAGGRRFVLTGDPAAENSLQRPTIVVPREEAIAQIAAGHVERLGPHSLTILRVPAGGGAGRASPSR
jgi:alpha-N-arabinofuranosidase